MPSSGSRATLVFLHPLGGSAETWKPVQQALEPEQPCVRLDLPGFGDAAHHGGRSVDGMADHVLQEVERRVNGRYVLVGHSMSAKVALLLARRAEDAGATGAAHLAGLVLAAGSPPSPEPMPDEKRAEMLEWFRGGHADSRRQADGFVRDNVAGALDGTAHESAVRDVLRGSRDAWTAWLERGSREDLSQRIGRVSVPALVLAGAEDEALGADAQRERMLPHLVHATLRVLDGAAHLLPLEQPQAVAAAIAAFLGTIDRDDAARRTTRRTEALLAQRGAPDRGYRAQVLDETGLAVLRRLLVLVLPMPEGIEIDLAARLDARLAQGISDGWRFAALPEDQDCARRAVRTLDRAARDAHGVGFAALDDAAAQSMLDRLADGGIGSGAPDALSGEAMTLWLQEVRGDCCQIFLTHPAVQRRAGLLAALTGGDAALQGFERIGADEADPWEDRYWQDRALPGAAA